MFPHFGDGQRPQAANSSPPITHISCTCKIRSCREWADRFGDGPGPGDRGDGLAALAFAFQQLAGSGPRVEDLNRRRELRAKIITSGDIVRPAVYSAISTT